MTLGVIEGLAKVWSGGRPIDLGIPENRELPDVHLSTFPRDA